MFAMQRTVFISHAHKDNQVCDQFAEALRQRGVDVWYDRSNMREGRSIAKEIERELLDRSGFIVLLTPAAVESDWVDLEIGAYRDLAVRDHSRLMLPVLIQHCDIPLLLRGIKWIDAIGLSVAETVDSILRALADDEDRSSSFGNLSSSTPAVQQTIRRRGRRYRFEFDVRVDAPMQTELAKFLFDGMLPLNERKGLPYRHLRRTYYRVERTNRDEALHEVTLEAELDLGHPRSQWPFSRLNLHTAVRYAMLYHRPSMEHSYILVNVEVACQCNRVLSGVQVERLKTIILTYFVNPFLDIRYSLVSSTSDSSHSGADAFMAAQLGSSLLSKPAAPDTP